MHLNQQQQQNGLLVSLDTPESNGHHEESPSNSFPLSSKSSSSTLQSTTKKFLFKNSDIIFENDLIQVGIKGELTKSSLHIELYYGNKTNVHLTNFSTNIFALGELESGKFTSFFVCISHKILLIQNFDLIWNQSNQQSIQEHKSNKLEQLIV